jgi:alpha-galactosidase
VIFDAAASAFAHHDRQAMLSLAEYAAAVGAETFLLDIEWCSRMGLDPYVDSAGPAATASPRDLDGLLARIRDFDLEIGFAVELESIDADSPMARDHPEWLLTVELDGMTRQVLDLSVRSAMAYVWERLTKLTGPPSCVPAELVYYSWRTPARGYRNAAHQHAGRVPVARCPT